MRSLKIVSFLGGLGNQMFQYAFYKALQMRFGPIKADISAFKYYPLHNGFELEHIFELRLNYSSKFENIFLRGGYFPLGSIWREICRTRGVYYECKGATYFDSCVLEDKGVKYYWGYWQNIKYFQEISDQIRSAFVFKRQMSDKNLYIKELIENSMSVSIHVRRGDYVGHSVLGGICDEDYYRRAIQCIEKSTHDATYFIFSNEINWCKEKLNLPNCHYVDWNKDNDSYVDMQLMSLCKHNIIANSSFSWWGAWLNKNSEKIVISPSRWFNEGDYDMSDLIPAEWICI